MSKPVNDTLVNLVFIVLCLLGVGCFAIATFHTFAGVH